MGRAAAIDRRSAMQNEEEDVIQRHIPTPRQGSKDGSATSPQHSSCHLVPDPAQRTIDLAHIRHVSRVNEDIANGSYKISSSDLADCLMQIAERDAERSNTVSTSSHHRQSPSSCDL